MKIAAMLLAIMLSMPAMSVYAGRDGAQLQLQEQLNKKVAAEKQKRPITQEETAACEATARRACPQPTSR